jgi:hypothetical protein
MRRLGRGIASPSVFRVIAVPAAELAKSVVAIGNCSGRATDKLAAFGLTRIPAR